MNFYQVKTFRLILPLFAIAICALSFASCGPLSNDIEGHPLGYDLRSPRVLLMPPVLNELSGLCYYPKDSSLFGIEDEEGYLYKIFPYRPNTMYRWKFGPHGDYEDVVRVDSTFYVLRSDGHIFSVVVRGVDDVQTTTYDFPEQGNEFESIYWDDTLKTLVLVCKDCDGDKNSSVSTWYFNPETHQFSAGGFSINAKDVAGLVGKKKIKLKPSAVAIHPITKQLFILSSVNKMLIIAKRDGTIDAAFNLDESLYKQPEGIAFAPDGTMFISNEQHSRGSATILMMPYHTKKLK